MHREELKRDWQRYLLYREGCSQDLQERLGDVSLLGLLRELYDGKVGESDEVHRT